ncbi:MAG: hypothetical protein A2Z69_00285 [Bacteroidetes bacterium RBG_13_44_24]|nr:MAG: hypothetical protein A2Z69_00285 [Bacteroidetes bacterium RBG_13_44_24]
MAWLSSLFQGIGSTASTVGKGIVSGAGKAVGLAEGAAPTTLWGKVGEGLGGMIASKSKTGQAISTYTGVKDMLTKPPTKKSTSSAGKTAEEMLWELAGLNQPSSKGMWGE